MTAHEEKMESFIQRIEDLAEEIYQYTAIDFQESFWPIRDRLYANLMGIEISPGAEEVPEMCRPMEGYIFCDPKEVDEWIRKHLEEVARRPMMRCALIPVFKLAPGDALVEMGGRIIHEEPVPE
jgi:hypothetical protein